MSAVHTLSPGSKPPRERVPPSEAEVQAAEDFLVGQLVGEGMDSDLVRHNAEARKIRSGALNAARRRLGLQSRSTSWDWSLPAAPTAEGAAALLRHRSQRRSSPDVGE